jgi:Flp pilus assembly pilin Flp
MGFRRRAKGERRKEVIVHKEQLVFARADLDSNWLEEIDPTEVLQRRRKMKKLIAFLKEEEGASLIEYVLLAVIIGVGCIVGMNLVQTQADAGLTEAANGMTPAV